MEIDSWFEDIYLQNLGPVCTTVHKWPQENKKKWYLGVGLSEAVHMSKGQMY